MAKAPTRNIFSRLRDYPDASVDEALAAALGTAEPVVVGKISAELLRRARPVGLQGLVTHFDRLPSNIQEIVLSRRDQLDAPLRRALRRRTGAQYTSKSEAGGNLIDIVNRTSNAQLAYLVAEQLTRGSSQIAEPAAKCLLQLTERVTALTQDPVDQATSIDNEISTEDQVPANDQRTPDIRRVTIGVEDAVRSYGRHQQEEVLQAMFHLVPRVMPRAVEALNDPRHPAVEPIRKMLAEAASPLVRQRLLWFLSIPTLKQPALAGLRSCTRQGRLDEPLMLGHLLHLPNVQKAIHRHGEAGLWPTMQQIAAMPIEASRYLIPLLDAMDIDPADKLMMLLPFADNGPSPELKQQESDTSRQVLLSDDGELSLDEEMLPKATVNAERLSTELRSLALHLVLTMHRRSPSVQTRNVLRAFAEDYEPTIARAATAALMYSKQSRALPTLNQASDVPVGDDGNQAVETSTQEAQRDELAKVCAVAMQSPAESVRTLASRQMRGRMFEQLWQTWPRMSPSRRREATSALIKLDANQFFAKLETKLAAFHDAKQAGAASAEVRRAIEIVRTTNQAAWFKRSLIQLTASSDRYVVASAAAALGRVATADAMQAVQVCMKHNDARVRANAIESFGMQRATIKRQQSTDQINNDADQTGWMQDDLRLLQPHAQRDANRPRANAIRDLLSVRSSSALFELTNMLKDQRPAHRVSALWVAESMGLIDVVGDVAELAVADPDVDVKARAGRVAQHLMTLVDADVNANVDADLKDSAVA